MAKHYLVIVFLVLLIGIGCKKEMPVRSDFELSATSENNTVVLNWTPVLLSGFKSINIYRSVSPIPDPLFNRPIDATLLIGTISDKTITSFRDSNMVMGTNGMVYYKVVLNLENRTIPSNEEQVSLDGFSISYTTNGFSSSSIITPFPEKNLVYIVNNNNGTLSVIDYSQKKILKTASFNQWGTLYPAMRNGNAELFMMNNSQTISCYDGMTFYAKFSINIPLGSIRDFKVKDNYLYVLYVYNYYAAKIRTYDLSTQTMVNEKTVYNSNNSFTCHLFVGAQSNKLFFKYYSQVYNSQLGYYVNRMGCVKYNMVNYLPADSVVIPPSLMNPDSLSASSSNYYYVQSSPDGNFLTCNDEGDVLSLADNSVHNIRSGNNSNPLVVYSHTGNLLLSKPNSNNSGISFNLLDLYSLPNFTLVKSVKSPNPAFVQGSSSFFKDDFLDNDSLVSYNLKHTFGNNQSTSVFTVFFNKIN